MNVPVSKFNSYNTFDSLNSDIVGVLSSSFPWRSFTDGSFPETEVGIFCVIENTVGQTLTFRVDGSETIFIGFGDLHEKAYSDMGISKSLFSSESSDTVSIEYSMTVYPSKMLEPRYLTAKPAIYASVVFIVFTFAFFIFIGYDCFVEQNQKKISAAADQAQAVVDSLFPEEVGQRLMQEAGQGVPKLETKKKSPWLQHTENNGNILDRSTAPIAEFFVNTTIMFGDIR